ncbi:MAG: MerR family transcriptional regulator [Chloroflexi bacterium]|nr:MerR family transcriptional regulator [Chloroflexota bacterium]MCC6893381.1 MerR family transcriptional regulator [Anaerolineae bacterium]
MFRIGDFSRLTRVSVKALRHYDALGLLKPAYVDPFTDYRYYSFDQLPRLNRILALKGLGFSLESIGSLLDDDLSAESLRGMLTLRRAQLEAESAIAREKLLQVEMRLHQIEQEGKMSKVDVLMKTVAPLMIAGAREVVPSPRQMRDRCIALNGEACILMAAQGLKSDGISFALYYPTTAEGIDVEMAYVVPDTTKPVQQGKAAVHPLPEVTVAYAVYVGSYDDFGAVGQVHADLNQWIESHGYVVSDASREFYLRPPKRFADPDGVMEIQYPVTKKA